MVEERHFNLSEVGQKVAEVAATTMAIFVKPEEKRVSEALSLLATGQTIQSPAINTIREFYNKGKAEKQAFFRTLMSLEQPKLEIVLNEIYAALDNPRWLIEMKEDLTALVKELREKGDPNGDKAYKNLEKAITSYFYKIFNYQYLVLRECDIYNTSVYLLKFMAAKEGVHPTEHWWSFEERLNRPDRFILSIEHFKMPNIPLVYIEIALATGIVRKLDQIADPAAKVIKPEAATAAMFYSINSTLKGLSGAGLGEKMIVLAKKHLSEKYPRLKYFATLSPVPRFRSYLDAVLADKKPGFRLSRQKIDENKKNRFCRKSELKECARVLNLENQSPSALLKAALSQEHWFDNAVLRSHLEYPLLSLLNYYLIREKRLEGGGAKPASVAYDPVANFHLSNGAYLGGLNYLANVSERGLKESYGMMVNYLYDSKSLDANKLAYNAGKVVAKV